MDIFIGDSVVTVTALQVATSLTHCILYLHTDY